MRRALIQFDPETYQQLRQRAFREERSIASLVRDLVTAGLLGEARHSRPSRISQFLSVGAGRSKQRRLSPVSEQHDAALEKAFDT
jgi:plasmid stability protein